MANKLRNKTARVSFFAFQDMVTTVTGVLMIVMLMLSIDLTERTSSATAVKQSNLAEQVQKARDQLKASLQTLQQRQADLSAVSNRVFVIPERDPYGKSPVLIVVSSTNGWVTRIGQTNRIEFRNDEVGNEFRDVLKTLDPKKDRLVFYIRPSGINHFNRCRQAAPGFSIGFDAADEEAQYTLANP